MRFLILLLLIPSFAVCQKLTNNDELYVHAINVLLDSTEQKIGKSTVVLEGEPANKLNLNRSNITLINSKQSKVYKSQFVLSKEYNHLVGNPLIRFLLKPTSISESNVQIPIFTPITTYKTRRKTETTIWEDGLWIFEYHFNCELNSFELVNIERGIIL